MSVQVKICGINSRAAADAAAQADADFAGLVFFARSPRFVGPDQAASLAAQMRGRCRIVALFADASDAAIEAAVRAARPDMLQLHGGETPERVRAIRSNFGLLVMKSISIADAGDLVAIARYEPVADMLLFDAKAPASADRPGGHGASFDWQLLRGRRVGVPWLLGGGLNAANVARAIHACDAPGVDVSSGVETGPGVKSPEMIRAFVSAARNAQVTAEAQA